jgi:hypothetical protein
LSKSEQKEVVWKTIPFAPMYEVSNTGVVKSKKKNTAVTPYKHTNGYYRVDLYISKKRCRFYLHRLIAELFIPNPDNKREVNHKDGNRENYNIDNLEWCTRSENELHKCRVLGKPPTREMIRKSILVCSKPVLCVETDTQYESISVAERKTGICHQSISNACNGKYHTAGGFHWQYAGGVQNA